MSRLRELRLNWTPPFTGGKNYIHLVLKVRPRRMACLLPFSGYSWVRTFDSVTFSSRTFDSVTCPICRGRMFAEAVLCALWALVKRLVKNPEVWALAIMAALIIAMCGCGGGSKQRKREVRTNEDVEIMSACTLKDCTDQPPPPPPRTPPPPPPVRRPDKARA